MVAAGPGRRRRRVSGWGQGPVKVAICPIRPTARHREPTPRGRVGPGQELDPVAGMLGHLVQTATLTEPWGRREAPTPFRHAAPGTRFLPPPPRSVHAVLPHTAHRRRSPPAFDLSRHGLNGRGATTVPFRSIRPN